MDLEASRERLIHWIKRRSRTAIFSWSRPGVENFGDELNSLIIPGLSGRPIFRVLANSRLPHVAAIGSVLHLVGPGATVWGSGAISREYSIARPTKVVAVRGPLTRSRLVEAGVECPAVYGDPGLLAPLVYSPRRDRPRRALGLVPHYVDYERARQQFPTLHVIDVRQPPAIVIDRIVECENIVSSSLHGVIVAEVFGVKARWVRFSNELIGGAFKFEDFYRSVGISGVEVMDLVDRTASEAELIRSVQENWRAPHIDLAPLLRAAPFRLTPEIERLAVRHLPLGSVRER